MSAVDELGAAGLPVRFRGIAEVVAVPQAHWRDLDRLSREADPDTQVALDRFLKRYGHVQSRVRSANLITDVGLNVAGGLIFPAGKWFVLAKGTGSPSNSDTMASHAGWSELTTYTQSTRPALTLGSWSGGVADNSAAVAIFTTPLAGLTYYGWGVVDAAAKGGTSGSLISVADHGSPQALSGGVALRQTLVATIGRA